MGREQKDAWDKWQVIGTLLGSILVPVALTAAGYYFSETLTRQQIRSSEEMATNNLRLGEFQIIAGLMKSLVSADSSERKQAINFVFLVMPEDEASRLVERLSKSDSDAGVRACATNAINARLEELASDAVSPNQQVSQAAYHKLTNAWRADPRVTKWVLAAAERSDTNNSSLANGINLLAGLDQSQLQPHSNDVARFMQRVPRNTPELRQRANQLEKKLQFRE